MRAAHAKYKKRRRERFAPRGSSAAKTAQEHQGSMLHSCGDSCSSCNCNHELPCALLMCLSSRCARIPRIRKRRFAPRQPSAAASCSTAAPGGRTPDMPL
eukprot:scaffold4491_cov119-Isochrysis_galbana.AAC.3